MDRDTFERLLYKEENEALDFKAEQYRFVKATDGEKAELLKDILGFANAWRRSEAFILIGVRDVRGGRAEVVGIAESDQLDDHSLQQFVNSLTNRPLRFRYEAFAYDGLQIGIIRIPQQPRPLFLKRDYGGLEKNAVYVRRGSSTDRTRPAGPDEIAEMGHIATPLSAEISVEFAEPSRDDSLGAQITCTTEYCAMPPAGSIPDLEAPRRRIGGLTIDLGSIDPFNRLNSEYYQKRAEYEFAKRFFRPVRLIVCNVGQVAASSVRVELTVSAGLDVRLLDASSMPDPPKRRWEPLSSAALIRPASSRNPGAVTIERNDDRTRVELECGDLQPGRKVWSDLFYVGKRTSGDIELQGQVLADNLPNPKDFTLRIAVTVVQTRLSVDELLDLPEPQSED